MRVISGTTHEDSHAAAAMVRLVGNCRPGEIMKRMRLFFYLASFCLVSTSLSTRALAQCGALPKLVRALVTEF